MAETTEQHDVGAAEHLEDATEDARRELGVRAVHAQRTKDALDAMSEEIKSQKKEVAA